MAGRGGRGAALLQALEQPARPPGQAAHGQNGRPPQPGQGYPPGAQQNQQYMQGGQQPYPQPYQGGQQPQYQQQYRGQQPYQQGPYQQGPYQQQQQYQQPPRQQHPQFQQQYPPHQQPQFQQPPRHQQPHFQQPPPHQRPPFQQQPPRQPYQQPGYGPPRQGPPQHFQQQQQQGFQGYPNQQPQYRQPLPPQQAGRDQYQRHPAPQQGYHGPAQQQHQYPSQPQQRPVQPQQGPVGGGQPYGRGGPTFSNQPPTGPQQPAPSFGRGAQVPSYGRSQPVQAPYGRGAPVGSPVPGPTSQPSPRPDPQVSPAPSDSRQTIIQPAPQERPSPQVPTEQLSGLKLGDTPKGTTKPAEKGTAGKPVPLSANYIYINSPEHAAYQYHVSFSPEIDCMKTRYSLVNEHRELLQRKLFDGAVMYRLERLEKPVTVLQSTRDSDGMPVQVTITFVKEVQPKDFLHVYNTAFRRIMKILQMKQVGHYFYDPHKPAPIPQHKLEVWPGYITAIHNYEGGLMLLCDVSHRVLRTDSCLDLMYDVVSRNRDRYKEEVTKQLVGSIILTRYNNQTYRIDDIDWDSNPRSQFTSHTGEAMTYVEYYRRVYNKTIQDLEQPLLVHRPKVKEPKEGRRERRRPQLEVVCLVPELCSLTGLTDNIRQDFRVMKDIAVHTRVSPAYRKDAMEKFIHNINGCPEAVQVLSNWGLKLAPSILKTEGRQLPLEKIILGSTSFTASPQADWSREAVKETVITPVGLQNWMVVVSKRDESKAYEFVNMMKKVTPSLGIETAQPQMAILRDDRTDTYLRAIREHMHPQLQVVVVIFPTSRDDRYAAIKKLCCVDNPVPSQVINAKTISQANKLRSVTQKVALQINCKLGGELWALEIPLKSLMVVGIDVYHDPTRGGRSVGGFVASMNKTLTRWYSRVCFQSPGQELIDGLKVALTSSLKQFHDINHTLPDRIVVFRDGVGDGQLPTVAGYEVQQLSECFALFGGGYEPRLAVVVVQKRINTRIFSSQGNGRSERLDNPPPGTIIDHTITRKDWYDFYLVSQHVRQGTVTPTHYIVVHDKSELKPDHLQRLSYKLTHLYYNWPGTVRVPAPCQYAHKLAYLVGQSIHSEPSHTLSNRLFFL